MKKLYFTRIDSEVCHSKEYFFEEIRLNGEIEVYEAHPEKVDGIFWCKVLTLCGETGEGTCGKDCSDYNPRNGKSGCCKYYTNVTYYPGDKVTLNN